MLLFAPVSFALTPEQQVEDFETFWREAEQHPSLTLYTPREELEAAKAATRAQLTVERDPIPFWGLLSQSAAAIGCGHTTLLPTLEAFKERPEGTNYFPLDLVVVDNRLHLDPRTAHTVPVLHRRHEGRRAAPQASQDDQQRRAQHTLSRPQN